MKDVTVDGILYALSDPIRRAILLKLLDCNGMSCSKAACSQLPPSTLSFHYKVLREAGLIRSQKKGVEVLNTPRKDEIEKRFPGLVQTILMYHKPLKALK